MKRLINVYQIYVAMFFFFIQLILQFRLTMKCLPCGLFGHCVGVVASMPPGLSIMSCVTLGKSLML